MNVDSAIGPGPLVQAWLASGRQLAVTAGSSVALISLFSDAPLRIASLRGAGAWAAVLALTSVGSWLAPRVFQDQEAEEDVLESESTLDSAQGATRP